MSINLLESSFSRVSMKGTHITYKKTSVNKLTSILLIAFAVIGGSGYLAHAPRTKASDNQINVWWPKDGSVVSGIQPFKAQLLNYDTSDYTMYWQVDNSQLNSMDTNSTDYPHKEASVDLSTWNWHADGKYPITFVAKDSNGNVISDNTVTILVGNQSNPVSSVTTSSTDETIVTPPTTPAPAVAVAPDTSSSTPVAQIDTPTVAPTPDASDINIYWPTPNATLSNIEPFKAILTNQSLDSYQMYWQVDGGVQNIMSTDPDTTVQEKLGSVDVSTWSWHGNGPYSVNFIAKDSSGNIISQKSVAINVNGQAPAQSNDPSQNTITQAVVTTPPVSTIPSIADAYNYWRTTYVTSDGANDSLRVKRPENSNDTVSEGQGYGMLAAVGENDKATFDQLWNYSKSHLNSNGLMGWHIDANNNTLDSGAATDADEDMAYALLMADKQWGGYTTDAKTLIGNIFSNEIEPGTYVVKPGDVWGGSDALDLSYFAPGYYKAFARYTGNDAWYTVVDNNYSILLNTENPTTGLVPDWSNSTGGAASYNMGPNQNEFTYDAIRVPWRLSLDAKWSNDSRAKQTLNKMSTFFASQVNNLSSGYQLDGTPTTNYINDVFTAGIAAGAAGSDNTDFANTMEAKLAAISPESYFGTSLRLLSLMTIENNFPRQ